MKKGDKFITDSLPDEVLTVVSFYCINGKEYETYNECKKENPKEKLVIVKNKEYGGSSSFYRCNFIK